MKTHLNLQAADLDRSVAYYRTLLGIEPTKRRDDYALFLCEDPPLELALDASSDVSIAGAHYGIVVDSTAAVDTAAERLAAAGLKTTIERDETCCYAKQTKVWSSDPDGRPWEIYTVLEETEERNDPGMSCCSEDGAATTCCV